MIVTCFKGHTYAQWRETNPLVLMLLCPQLLHRGAKDGKYHRGGRTDQGESGKLSRTSIHRKALSRVRPHLARPNPRSGNNALSVHPSDSSREHGMLSSAHLAGFLRTCYFCKQSPMLGVQRRQSSPNHLAIFMSR